MTLWRSPCIATGAEGAKEGEPLRESLRQKDREKIPETPLSYHRLSLIFFPSRAAFELLLFFA